ncbi:glyoxalase superfamily protein [Roseateles sp.]|uniref:glyoxalase superfamily protein n=1 Tax=Roseateles sp. TaxID=1971397 RepID=UPI0039EA9082
MSQEDDQVVLAQIGQYMVLPAGPTPRILTANAPSRTLHDHFLAFLASNNESGFDESAVAQLPGGSIGDLMLLVAQRESLSVRSFKDEAKKLRKASGGALRHVQCLELLSRLFGYKDWNHACARVSCDRLANRRNRDHINMKIFNVMFKSEPGGRQRAKLVR